jgi:uncharacterized protein (DUF433 family)
MAPNVPPWRAYRTDAAARGCFKDTRMPVATVFENLEAGLTLEEVMEESSVTREQINAVLHFAAKSLCSYTGMDIPFP